MFIKANEEREWKWLGKVLSENEYFLAALYTWENDYRSLLQGQSDFDEQWTWSFPQMINKDIYH